MPQKITIRQRYAAILEWFAANRPAVQSELHFKNGYELIVSVILSAQCTDKRVNTVTPALFERFPDPESLAAASFEETLALIRSVSYPNSKARHLIDMARKLVTDFHSVIPSDIDSLMSLPGVGRKTATVVGAVIWHKEVMPVDTHVFRVSARIGLTRGARTPLQTELQLEKNIPHHLLPVAHHWLILHGRYVCTARAPHCDTCGISAWCRHHAEAGEKATDKSADKNTPKSRVRGAKQKKSVEAAAPKQ